MLKIVDNIKIVDKTNYRSCKLKHNVQVVNKSEIRMWVVVV